MWSRNWAMHGQLLSDRKVQRASEGVWRANRCGTEHSKFNPRRARGGGSPKVTEAVWTRVVDKGSEADSGDDGRIGKHNGRTIFWRLLHINRSVWFSQALLYWSSFHLPLSLRNRMVLCRSTADRPWNSDFRRRLWKKYRHTAIASCQLAIPDMVGILSLQLKIGKHLVTLFIYLFLK